MKFWKFEYEGSAALSDFINNRALPSKNRTFPGLENTHFYPIKVMKVGDGVVLATLHGDEGKIFAVGVVLLAMPAGSCYAASQMVLPNQVRGQALALILFVANLGGLTMGPLLPGLLNDFVFRSESALGLSLGITLSISTLLAALAFGWGRADYRRHHEILNP